jgi:uncharacterized DUF497 family protein
MIQFEWDVEKENRNITKHGVNFREATTVFSDPLELTIADPDHSLNEMRWLSIAHSSKNRLLVVSYTEREGRIRIISARPAVPMERRQYESS